MHSTRLIACLLPLVPLTAPAAEPTFRVVGYLPEYRAAQFDPAAAKLLTDLVVFSARPTAEGEIDLARLGRIPWEKLRTARTAHKVRLILCVGGWGRSDGFAAVAASEERRKRFAAAAVRACRAEQLDGVDLDWEHPKGAAEEAGYGKVLAELKGAFQPHGLVLSVTIAGWQKLPAEAYAAVDVVQVMAYDHGGKHSTFEAAAGDVKKVTDGGAPAAKVVLGVPFYGRGVTERGRTLAYREIVARYRPEGGTDEVDGVYFNGPDTVRKKVAFARENGLGGVMVWEVGQDAAGEASLLRVIRTEADRKR
jgi:GH18 family chitinase